MPNNRLAIFFSDLILVWHYYRDSFRFVRDHQLWKGIFEVKWFARLVIGAILIIALQLYWIAQKAFGTQEGDESVVTAAFHSMGTFFTESYDFLFAGAFKYIVIVIFEIIVFHFIRKTIETITGFSEEVTVSAFKSAFKRMIKISIRNYIYEMILSLIAGIILGILGLTALKVAVVFVIQCYFLGFTLIDNYHEIQKLSIKDSEKLTRRFPGVAMGVGAGFNLLILIPIIGPILAPVLGGVTAARSMHALRSSNMV